METSVSGLDLAVQLLMLEDYQKQSSSHLQDWRWVLICSWILGHNRQFVDVYLVLETYPYFQ